MLRSFSLEMLEIVIPDVKGLIAIIPSITIKRHPVREKIVLNVKSSYCNIEALKDNLAPSFDFMTKSSTTSLIPFSWEETNTIDNSLPESETFSFDMEENK
ncbi:hypothetical protein Tco_1190965 [Tanacetum coccineum]